MPDGMSGQRDRSDGVSERLRQWPGPGAASDHSHARKEPATSRIASVTPRGNSTWAHVVVSGRGQLVQVRVDPIRNRLGCHLGEASAPRMRSATSASTEVPAKNREFDSA